MARRIIVLDQIGMPSDFSFRVAYWLNVPTARQPFYANPSATSKVVGATTDEVNAIISGAVVEVVETLPLPFGTNLSVVALPAMIARGTDLQNQLNANNPWHYYGTNFDGTSWSVVTTA